jgi:hypothetical protein
MAAEHSEERGFRECRWWELLNKNVMFWSMAYKFAILISMKLVVIIIALVTKTTKEGKVVSWNVCFTNYSLLK